jgi:hypothetical protein
MTTTNIAVMLETWVQLCVDLSSIELMMVALLSAVAIKRNAADFELSESYSTNYWQLKEYFMSVQVECGTLLRTSGEQTSS